MTAAPPAPRTAPAALALSCNPHDLPPTMECVPTLFSAGWEREILQRLVSYWKLHGWQPVKADFIRRLLRDDFGEAKAKEAEAPGRELITKHKYLACPAGKVGQLCPTQKLVDALRAGTGS